MRPVLVVDGDRASRELLASLFATIGRSVEHAATGAEALVAARAERPCLAVVETHLPDISGYEVCRELRDEFGETLPIVFVSASRNEPNDRVAGLLLGADDYFPKPPPVDEFLARVRRLLARTASASGNGPSKLTPREREVLALMVAGRRREEIARQLVISPKTAAKHIEKILAKLGVNTQAQAVGLALREGVLDDAA